MKYKQQIQWLQYKAQECNFLFASLNSRNEKIMHTVAENCILPACLLTRGSLLREDVGNSIYFPH